ncbi:hypothetical protein HDU80_010004 [Chytriomyces hyalinus]|nr:hypothetical protein HDU80_010004 [Chytriomyces hyalinus]
MNMKVLFVGIPGHKRRSILGEGVILCHPVPIKFNDDNCKNHELAMTALQRQMLEEVNSLRKLLQMQSIHSFVLSPPVATPACAAPACTAPSRPVLQFTPSIPTLESMPPEALDRIASFVGASDILQLCHAVRYFKYISKAMFDFGQLCEIHKASRPETLWPIVDVVLFRNSVLKPTHLRALGTYSRVLSKHGGSASINYSAGMEAILPVLPENLEVWIDSITQLANENTDAFFSAIFSTNKTIICLTLGAVYLGRCNSNPVSLDLTTKWLAKLRIHELGFEPFSSIIPTQIRDMLHLVPMLASLHLQTLEDFVGVSLSEFKSLRKLSISGRFFRANKKPEALVLQLLDIVEATKIQQLEVSLPWGLQQVQARSKLKGLLTALFPRYGWREQRGQSEYHFVCTRRK